MKRRDAPVISAGVAHVLAWIVGLLLVVVPGYQGVSAHDLVNEHVHSISGVERTVTCLAIG